jgi:pilus assembly protein Flp/PilA
MAAFVPLAVWGQTGMDTQTPENVSSRGFVSWLATLAIKEDSAMCPRMVRWLVEFLRCEDGPTAVEYAVMLALIIVVCLSAISFLGAAASATFTSVGNTIGAS